MFSATRSAVWLAVPAHCISREVEAPAFTAACPCQIPIAFWTASCTCDVVSSMAADSFFHCSARRYICLGSAFMIML
jgi:hypothetical protein